MRKQDQLNELIKSLSKQEKRYFKLFASLQAGDKKFIRLFDELAKSGTYEPRIVANKLKIAERNLVDVKGYLQKNILSSLRLYEEDSDPVSVLHSQWQTVRLLQKRNQLQLAYSINEKTIEKARSYENFNVLNLCLQQKYNLLLHLDRTSETAPTIEELNGVFKQMGEVWHLMVLTQKYAAVIVGMPNADAIKKIMADPVIKMAPGKLSSQSARLLWHSIHQHYYSFSKPDIKKSTKHIDARIAIFDTNPGLIYTWPVPYLDNFHYLSMNYVQSGKYAEAQKCAERLEKETAVSRNDIPANLCAVYNVWARLTMQNIFCITERFNDALILSERLYETKGLQVHTFIIASHHYALALFYTGQYEKSKQVCDKLIALNTDALKEIQLSTRILLVMINDAIGNYNLLQYLINSAGSWAKRHHVVASGTASVMQQMKNFQKVAGSGKQSAFFNDLKNELELNTLGEYANLLGLNTWVKAAQ
jgi:hypothetical protein